jgi:hypothetical protein
VLLSPGMASANIPTATQTHEMKKLGDNFQSLDTISLIKQSIVIPFKVLVGRFDLVSDVCP